MTYLLRQRFWFKNVRSKRKLLLDLVVVVLIRTEPDPSPVFGRAQLVDGELRDLLVRPGEIPSPWFFETPTPYRPCLSLAHPSSFVGVHVRELAASLPAKESQAVVSSRNRPSWRIGLIERRVVEPSRRRVDLLRQSLEDVLRDEFQSLEFPLENAPVGADHARIQSTAWTNGGRRPLSL